MSDDRMGIPVYVGRCSECQSVRAAVVDDPSYQPHMRREVAKDCASFIRGGLNLERTTVGAFRASGFGECLKPHPGTTRCSRLKLRKVDRASSGKPVLPSVEVGGATTPKGNDA